MRHHEHMSTENRPCEDTGRRKPRREASGETKPANTSTSDSSLQNCEKYISVVYTTQAAAALAD